MNPTHYLIIDFEATCCDRNTIPRAETEIIEIGAVMADGATLAVVDEFTTFVRPIRHPALTAFCTRLTSITQDQVDAAPLFAEAIARLVDWTGRYPGALFCSWGDYDRKQLSRECEIHGVEYPFGEDHLNLKRRFSERLRTSHRYGLAQALKTVGLPLEGTHHRGIDDARNIARLLPLIVEPGQEPPQSTD